MVREKNYTKIISVFGLLLVLFLVYSLVTDNESNNRQRVVEYNLLNRGVIGEPDTLDPHNFLSVQASKVLRDLGEGLVSYTSDGKLKGAVAESWTISDDGLVYLFTLRPGARWSTGETVTAEDFVRTFRELVSPSEAAVNAHFIEQVSMAPAILSGEAAPEKLGVEAIGERGLKISLHTPTPHFIQLLAHPSTFPIHNNGASADSNAGEVSLPSVWNGAYTLENWIVGSELVLARNKNYWDDRNTFFNSVVYHVVQETTEFTRFRAGELDITENVPSAAFEMVRREFGQELRVSPYLGIYYYGFNLSKGVFANRPKLRKALSLAIDRNVLVRSITARGEEPAYSWVPPGVYNYSPQKMEEADLDEDRRKALARQLYSESGYGPNKPLEFELRYNTSDVQQRIAVAVQAMWAETLGAEVSLVNEEFKVLLSNIRAGEVTEVFRLSWMGDYNDAHTFLQLFESDDPSNMTGYFNSEYDDLIDRAERESDLNNRRELLEESERLVIAEHPVIPLYFYVSKHLVNSQLEGWEDNILDQHPSRYLSLRQH